MEFEDLRDKATKVEKPKEAIAWAIKHKDILPYTTHHSKDNCISSFEEQEGLSWGILKRIGYSCVKVKITEV